VRQVAQQSYNNCSRTVSLQACKILQACSRRDALMCCLCCSAVCVLLLSVCTGNHLLLPVDRMHDRHGAKCCQADSVYNEC
jgi:hypothetical protein